MVKFNVQPSRTCQVSHWIEQSLTSHSTHF